MAPSRGRRFFLFGSRGVAGMRRGELGCWGMKFTPVLSEENFLGSQGAPPTDWAPSCGVHRWLISNSRVIVRFRKRQLKKAYWALNLEYSGHLLEEKIVFILNFVELFCNFSTLLRRP